MIIINIIQNTLQRFNFSNSHVLFSMDMTPQSDNNTLEKLIELKEFVKESIEINENFEKLLPYEQDGLNITQETTGIGAPQSDNNTLEKLIELKELVKENIEINKNFEKLLPYEQDGVNLEQETTGIGALFKKDGVLNGVLAYSTLYIYGSSFDNNISKLDQKNYEGKLYTYSAGFGSEKNLNKENNKIVNISEFITDKISDYVAEILSKETQKEPKELIKQILSNIRMSFILCSSNGIYSNVSNVSNTLTFTFNSNEAAQSMGSCVNTLQTFGTVSFVNSYGHTINIINVQSDTNKLNITCDNSPEVHINYFVESCNKYKAYLSFDITRNKQNKTCYLKEELQSKEDQQEQIEGSKVKENVPEESEEDVETEPDSEGENYQESNKDNDKTKKKTTIKKKNNKSWFATNAWTCIGGSFVALTSVVCGGYWYAFEQEPKQSTSQVDQQENTDDLHENKNNDDLDKNKNNGDQTVAAR